MSNFFNPFGLCNFIHFAVLQPVFCHFPLTICPLASTIVLFEFTHNAFFSFTSVIFLFPSVLKDHNILSIFKSSHIFQAVVTLYSQHEFFSWAMKAFSVLSALPQRQLWAHWPGSWGKTGSRVSIWQPPSSMYSSASPGTRATLQPRLTIQFDGCFAQSWDTWGEHICFLENHNTKYSFHNMTHQLLSELIWKARLLVNVKAGIFLESLPFQCYSAKVCNGLVNIHHTLGERPCLTWVDALFWHGWIHGEG